MASNNAYAAAAAAAAAAAQFEEAEEDDGDEDGEEDVEEEEGVDEDADYVPPHPIYPPQPILVEDDDQIQQQQQQQDNAANAYLPSLLRVLQAEESAEPSCFACSICMEPWSSQGIHRTCCLPCGHLYGRSCIEKWLRQRKTFGRCPQCNMKCRLMDIRNIYAPHVAVANEDLQKEMCSLRSENERLKRQNTSLLEEVRLHKVALATTKMMPLQGDDERMDSDEQTTLENSTALRSSGFTSYAHGRVALKAELAVDGARVFDMDIWSQILVLCRRPSGLSRSHVLTKFSLLSQEFEDMFLPSCHKTVKDVKFSPSPRRLALVAAMEKKVSIVSMESNNVVLSYSLPAPAWSCSWDFDNVNHVYAGLQNGDLAVLDLRQTREPVKCINGQSTYPVHTVHYAGHDRVHVPSVAELLTASSSGPCQWNIGSDGERKFLIPGIENQGVCISLAYSGANGDIITTFRPKILVSNDMMASQPALSPPAAIPGPVTRGSLCLLKRVDDVSYQNFGPVVANVSAIRMPKSTIISRRGYYSLFAYGDETSNRLCLRELPSLELVNYLQGHSHPILDVKYAHANDTGFLGCVSENKLQLYSCFND